jgi:HK97 family phage prohead protease
MKKKQLNLADVLFKFDDDTRTFEGYASKFDGLDSYGDSIVKGAYVKTLEDRQRPIRMRWNHYGPVIGKWDSISEDAHGLLVKGSLTPGHSVAEDVYASMKHGAVDGMSIGYIPRSEEERDGVNYLKEIELIEISVVEEPADRMALISAVKGLELKLSLDECLALKDVENLMRDALGLSRTDATALISRVKSLSLGDQARKSDIEEFTEMLRGIKFDR